MGGEENGRAGLRRREKGSADGLGCAGIKAPARLVDEEEPGGVRELNGEHEQAPRPTGEVARVALAELG